MGALRKLQEKFAVNISILILESAFPGAKTVIQSFIRDKEPEIGLTFGDAYRDPKVFGEVGEKLGYGEAYSCHKSRLAVDLNANKEEHHIVLHNIWDTLNGSKRIAQDMNHYSYSYNGMR